MRWNRFGRNARIIGFAMVADARCPRKYISFSSVVVMSIYGFLWWYYDGVSELGQRTSIIAGSLCVTRSWGQRTPICWTVRHNSFAIDFISIPEHFTYVVRGTRRDSCTPIGATSKGIWLLQKSANQIFFLAHSFVCVATRRWMNSNNAQSWPLKSNFSFFGFCSDAFSFGLFSLFRFLLIAAREKCESSIMHIVEKGLERSTAHA